MCVRVRVYYTFIVRYTLEILSSVIIAIPTKYIQFRQKYVQSRQFRQKYVIFRQFRQKYVQFRQFRQKYVQFRQNMFKFRRRVAVLVGAFHEFCTFYGGLD